MGLAGDGADGASTGVALGADGVKIADSAGRGVGAISDDVGSGGALASGVRSHAGAASATKMEAMHLLGRRPAGSRACLEFFIRPGALLVPMTPARLLLCRDLMAHYADAPMDFADATLVALAEEFGIGHVLTLDRRGFATYRWRRTRRFTIAPA
jgi:hypothetical protein